MSKAGTILTALVAGLVIGILAGGAAPWLTEGADILGTLWLNALRMTVIPLVVALLITGIVQTAAAARAGKLATRAVITMLAILWASSIMSAFATPALLAAFPMPQAAGEALKTALSSAPDTGEVKPFSEFLRAIIPTNPFAAAASDAVLPLMIFTITFAFAVTRLPDARRATIGGFFEAVADAMIIVIHWVLWLAPAGVFALAFVVGTKAGAAAFGGLAHYVAVVTMVGTIVWLASFAVAALGGRRSPIAFFRAAIPAQAVAISTQSSLVSLPAMVDGVKAVGVPDSTADVVLPMAVAIFRATGPAMNLAVAIYVAHWMGIALTPWALAAGVAAAATTTLGAVSLPGTITFVSSIAPICLAMGLPVEPLALLLAVETFPDIMRTLGNVTMDMAVTTTVAERGGKAG